MPGGPVVLNNTPLAARDSGDRARALQEAPWIRSVEVSQPKRVLAFAGLDRGEAEVLALAEEHAARLIILDEKKARRYAERLGFAKTGTLGILLLAKEKGLIDSLRVWVERLREAGLYLTEPLIQKALEIDQR